MKVSKSAICRRTPLYSIKIAKRPSHAMGLIVLWCCAMTLLMNLTGRALCNNVNNDIDSEIVLSSTSATANYANESLSPRELCHDDSSEMVWSQFLEDYVVSKSPNNRFSKDLQFLNDMNKNGPGQYQMMVNPGMGPNPMNPQSTINYHSSAYKRPNGNNVYINKRIGEIGVELEPHKRPPVQVLNPQFRPMTNQMSHQQPAGFLHQLFGGTASTGNYPSSASTVVNQQQHQQQQHVRPMPLQQQHNSHNSGPAQTFRAVSENDLYLLGAIEKLVYRVDYLESRVRRAEQLIYYLMAGNKQQEVRDPCPVNFTRISDNCYYINSYQQLNWKTANSACKGLNSHLAEFEKISENEEIMAYLLNQPNHRGRDYWLGGLNPGLLWIWSHSAKPVNPNMNLTSIAMSHKKESTNETDANTIDVDEKDEKRESVINNTIEIPGQGRCLRLSYNSAKHSYNYHGQECTTRHNYICEHEDKTLDNKIKKIARELQLFD